MAKALPPPTELPGPEPDQGSPGGEEGVVAKPYQPEPEPLIQAKDLAVELASGQSLFKKASFELFPGEVLWLSGPSGGGKSTLLRLLNNLSSPQEGEILVQGKPVSQWRPEALRRRVALLQQTPVMLDATVGANLRLGFGLKAAGKAPPPDDEALAKVLGALGLEDLALEKPAGPLSVGQKQRVALARLLLLEPRVLLLDEPVAALDPASRELVESTACGFAASGGGVVLVSHLEPRMNGCKVRPFELREGELKEAGL